MPHGSGINGWNDVEKLQWMHVHLTGKAHVALTRGNHDSYAEAKAALTERFDLPVMKELYKAELKSRVKWRLESWGDYGNQLGVLVDKAYPELQREAREYIALNIYLDQLQQLQIALGVRQKRPKTIQDAVQATI